MDRSPSYSADENPLALSSKIHLNSNRSKNNNKKDQESMAVNPNKSNTFNNRMSLQTQDKTIPHRSKWDDNILSSPDHDNNHRIRMRNNANANTMVDEMSAGNIGKSHKMSMRPSSIEKNKDLDSEYEESHNDQQQEFRNSVYSGRKNPKKMSQNIVIIKSSDIRSKEIRIGSKKNSAMKQSILHEPNKNIGNSQNNNFYDEESNQRVQRIPK